MSGVAAIALFAGSGSIIAEQMIPSADNETAEKFLAVARAMQQDTEIVPAVTPEPGETDGIFRKITIPAQGVFRFEAAAGSGIELYVDGTLAIDATGPALDDNDAPVRALQTLSPGDHAIRIVVAAENLPALEALTFGALGAEPRSLLDVTQQISPDEGMSLAAKNSAVMPGTDTASLPQRAEGGLLGISNGNDKAPFSIGGSSNKTARNAPASSGSDSAGGSGDGGGSMGTNGGLRTAALAPSTQSTTPTTSTTSSGGGIAAVPSGSGGSGTAAPGTPTAPGTPSTPGTPTANPSAPPPPTPIDPGAAPTAETVQASPLSPPTDVEITQAVQLTSAGNVNGQVPANGSTLFGAVMNHSMFDIVTVPLSGSNRTTTVDVGPVTGQFAVRLFPEDFGAGNQVEVTLTGASTASDEVEATPVSYTLTAMPAQDGVSQALSRLTFGATPDLYARVRAIGFQNYVEEQLNPDSINDQAFNSMNTTPLQRSANFCSTARARR